MAERQHDLFETTPEPWEVDDAAETLVATIVFPSAPHGDFDYRVPDALRDRIHAGCRVKVPLGRGNRAVVGYCVDLAHKTTDRRIKDVRQVVDGVPLISAPILRLTRWMAKYYVCRLGTILEAVVPASVRLRAGTRDTIFLHVPTNVVARMTQLKLPRRQAEVLKYLASSTEPRTSPEIASAVGCTTGPIKALRDKGLIRAEKKRIHTSEFDEAAVARSQPHVLNDDQERALCAISELLHAGRHETVLLYGVTGSGKTEVYIQAIEQVIGFGRQAIVLVPEISLTPQTQRRFRARFDNVAVLHSNLSPPERHWQWQRIARGEVNVVVGARSAVFAPTPHLGLIVVDEEHEPSFKQEVVPRYHARDVALRRAAMEDIPVILGSATPALESWQRAKEHRHRLTQLPRRILDRPLPDVGTIDLRNQDVARTYHGALSRRLRQAVAESLRQNGQVILLLNRRGFSTHIQCPACGEVVRCPACDIALTHHRDGEKAICHYCDYQIPTPPNCPNCQFSGIRFGGLGTQRLEAEVRASFPDATCLRMDSDTMRGPGSHEQALDRFRHGEVQILLGTQMIAKGLDFPNVTLVGVINADTALHLPDFRAGERTFQLVTQVAGRTGRGEKGGRVLVQTFSPDHPAIQAATRHDYAAFASAELPTRREFQYPPFSHMVRLVFRGPSAASVEAAAERIADELSRRLDAAGQAARMLGPAPAPIAKLRGKFRAHMLIQSEQYAPLCDALHELSAEFAGMKDVEWVIDVDPLSML